MKEAWQQELARIVDFLNNAPEYESKNLWAVLTALRGPDNDGQEQKWATTSVIRHAAGLSPFGAISGRAIINSDTSEYAKLRAEKYSKEFRDWKWDHFYSHAVKAFDALGLLWEQENPNRISIAVIQKEKK